MCAGEVAWDFVAVGGAALEDAPPLTPTPGGGAANTALELARLGLRAALCAAVGDDPLGAAMRRRLERAGVDTSLITLSPDVRTGLVLIGGAASRGRRFQSYRAPDDEARALRKALPARVSARVLHLSALIPSLPSLALFRAAIRRARLARPRPLITLDINARPRLWRAPRGAPLELLRDVDWIKCSEGDLEAMRAAPTDLLAHTKPSAVLIITNGPHPIRAIGPFGSLEHAPPPLANVDPTGAGDAFCAGLLAELIAHDPKAPSAALAARAIERGINTAREHLARRQSASGASPP